LLFLIIKIIELVLLYKELNLRKH